MERAVLMCKGEILTLQELPAAFQPRRPEDEGLPPDPSPQDMEREYIRKTLERFAFDREEVARRLEISLEELNFKIKVYGLEPAKEHAR